MGWGISDVTRAIARGEHDVAHTIGNTLIDAGHAASDQIRNALNRLPGGMRIGDKVTGIHKRVPSMPYKPGEMQAPHPGDFPIISLGSTGAQCGDLKKWGGSQPFPLVGFKSLAAGAQTQGTDIVSFHASASNPTVITTDDLILGNVEVWEASLYISARLVTTLGFEGAAYVNSSWVIEYINGIEKARWAVKQLALLYGVTGIVTSGAASHHVSFDLASIPWHRKYDPNIKAKTALQISVTTTTVSAMDHTFVETGVRA